MMPPLKLLKCLVPLGACLLFIQGCANTPEPRDAAGNIPYHGTGKARVFVYAAPTLDADVEVRLDGNVVGTAKPQSYFVTETTPGQHSLVTEPAAAQPLSFHLDKDDDGYVRLDKMEGRLTPLFVNSAVGKKDVATQKQTGGK